MTYLVDTNVMFWRVLLTDPLHSRIKVAINKLTLHGHELCITGQNLIEYWALATRSIAANGLGLTPTQVISDIQDMKVIFNLLLETPAVYPTWESIVSDYGIIGRQVFDARLVAFMQVYGISHILTLNPQHFLRFAGLTVVDPQVI